MNRHLCTNRGASSLKAMEQKRLAGRILVELVLKITDKGTFCQAVNGVLGENTVVRKLIYSSEDLWASDC